MATGNERPLCPGVVIDLSPCVCLPSHPLPAVRILLIGTLTVSAAVCEESVCDTNVGILTIFVGAGKECDREFCTPEECCESGKELSPCFSSKRCLLRLNIWIEWMEVDESVTCCLRRIKHLPTSTALLRCIASTT